MKRERKLLIIRTIITGFIGGILLYLAILFFTYFNFIDETIYAILISKINLPASIHKPLFRGITLLFILGLTSTVIALIYYGLLRKIFNIWVSVLFGLGIFGLSILLIKIYVKTKNWFIYDGTTYITLICLFILYGLFIGYSIAFDYNDTKGKSDENN